MSFPAHVQTFWLEPTGTVRRYLRRYHSPESGHYSSCADGWHEAVALLDCAVPGEGQSSGDLWPHDDPRWPGECAKGCGYRFVDGDAWQLSIWREYTSAVRPNETFVLEDEQPGAMWDADWYPWKGQDGRSVCVILPNGHAWSIDMRASNCTKPDEPITPPDARQHWCWVRHGDPTSEPVTVDKNGPTCDAGGGSILSGEGADEYHGFLTAGAFAP